MSHLVLWEFRPRPGRAKDFEVAYGPEGAWVRFFRKSDAYLGSELLRDEADPSRYLTVDRWISRECYEEFRRRYSSEYQELDGRCELLTEHEARLGLFRTLDP